MKINSRICLLVKIAKESIMRLFKRYEILYVIENANWSIRDDGVNLAKGLIHKKMILGIYPLFVKNKIIHYGSFNSLITSRRVITPHKSNKVIATVFHIKPNDPRVERIKNGECNFVNLWHTTNQIVQKELISLGIPKEKIIIIPLHIDNKVYSVALPEERNRIRKLLGIKSDEIAIGSFQKDGEGWGDGNNPKLIKGPDIFCDVVEKLAEKYNIKIVLTGPARGYVINRLSSKGIKYVHHFLEEASDVAKYYNALDLYIIASRVEGGPKSILESMATGVPLLTTRVGMATDMVKTGENGILCDVEDKEALIEGAEMLISHKELREKCIAGGLKTAKEYDYSDMPRKFHKLLYERLDKYE